MNQIMNDKKQFVKEEKSSLQFYSSVTSTPIMTIAGLFIGYYGGESISPGLGTPGALFGALFFFFLGIIELFRIGMKESKIASEKQKNKKLSKEKDLKNSVVENLFNEDNPKI